jgi:ribosomal protein L37AE/L43A
MMTEDDAVKAVAERAALGQVLAACPRCGDFTPRETNRGRWSCSACGHVFTVPAYFQRVPAPVLEPEAPETPGPAE